MSVWTCFLKLVFKNYYFLNLKTIFDNKFQKNIELVWLYFFNLVLQDCFKVQGQKNCFSMFYKNKSVWQLFLKTVFKKEKT